MSERGLMGALGVVGVESNVEFDTGGDLMSEGGLIGALGVVGVESDVEFDTGGDLMSEGGLMGALGVFGTLPVGEAGGVPMLPGYSPDSSLCLSRLPMPR